jgi:hypothetical protein
VQAAAREARMSIYGLQQDGDLVDWALPSLSAASPSLALFTPRAPPADPDFDQCEEFESARMFANCDEGRRLLTTWLCPTRPVAAHARPAHVVLLTGSSRSGKSHLLKWAMESWILGGARVRYIELHDGTALGFVSILRLIRDGTGQNGKGLLQRRLPTAPFRRFTWTLVNRLKTGRPGEWNEAHHPGDEVADDFTLTLLPANGEKRLEPEICAEFHAALQQVAEERPLVLVFDKFTSGNSRLVSPDDFELIVNHLFKPIAQDKSSRVKLVFCANALEREIYKLSDLPQTVNCSVPANITDDLLADYAVEMMRFDETYPAVTASTLRAKLKVLAEAVFGLPTLDDPLQQPQGMAKLGKLDSLLKQSGYNKPPRMR